MILQKHHLKIFIWNHKFRNYEKQDIYMLIDGYAYCWGSFYLLFSVFRYTPKVYQNWFHIKVSLINFMTTEWYERRDY